LRQALFLKLRNRGSLESLVKQEGLREALDAGGRLRLRQKDVRFWPAVGVILDVLAGTEARVGEAARSLGLTTGNLVDFLSRDSKVWAQVNAIRAAFGAKPLRG
jgi:hypothetical protein